MAVVIRFLLLLAVCSYSLACVCEDKENLQSILKLLNTSQTPERYCVQDNNSIVKYVVRDPPLVGKYSWKSCGQSSDPLTLDVSISPDPIVLPGFISFSASVDLSTDIPAPIEVQLTIEKKIFFVWFTVPCVNDFGSCTYDNICDILSSNASSSLRFLTDKVSSLLCPLRSVSFTIPPIQLYLPISLGDTLTSGDYRIKVVMKSEGVQFGCYRMQFSLNGAHSKDTIPQCVPTP